MTNKTTAETIILWAKKRQVILVYDQHSFTKCVKEARKVEETFFSMSKYSHLTLKVGFNVSANRFVKKIINMRRFEEAVKSYLEFVDKVRVIDTNETVYRIAIDLKQV